LFENLEPKPADAILKLIAEHQNDSRAEKVDLGVGVYRDAAGKTPIMAAVKQAERWLLDNQDSKAYLGSRGDIQFCRAIERLLFADNVDGKRVTTVQTPGGSGALRVGAELILRSKPDAKMFVSTPTWNNHVPLLGEAGVNLREYPYYDRESNTLDFDSMLQAVREGKAGDFVLLHGCCHNPTGMDLIDNQWRQLADVIVEQDLIPFIDIAYQGFARGIDDDAFGVRLLADRVPEMLVSHSCSKNFGLYRDRVGALSVLTADAKTTHTVDTQLLSIVRTMYSLPPDHGAAVVARILDDDETTKLWQQELTEMRERMRRVRSQLVASLKDVAPEHDFQHIEQTTGMFCYLGLSADQVAKIKSDHGIYLVDSSRINVCGINDDNVDYIAGSIAAVID